MGGQQRFDLSVPQIVGGALATMTAAVAASYLGVAGTVIGAAVMSVGSTVGGAVYTHYLKRTGSQLTFLVAHETDDDPPKKVEGKGELATAVQATVREEVPAGKAGGPAPVDPDAPTSVFPAVGGTPAESVNSLDDLVVVDVNPATAEMPRIITRGPRVKVWMLAVTAAVTFVVSMGVILGFEGLTGQPVSSTLKGEKSSGTSLNPGAGERRKGPERVKTSRPASPAPSTTAERTPGPASTADSGPTRQPTTEPTSESTPPPTPTQDPTSAPTSGPTPVDPSSEPSEKPGVPSPPSETVAPEQGGLPSDVPDQQGPDDGQ
ncbi:hypothetical protein AB0B56_39640 [Streptosporangium canum]|uniref:hypothetical protein n=1 Tax=Streptosporangium canum TaxID=324952 RepID=UPI00343F585D